MTDKTHMTDNSASCKAHWYLYKQSIITHNNAYNTITYHSLLTYRPTYKDNVQLLQIQVQVNKTHNISVVNYTVTAW